MNNRRRTRLVLSSALAVFVVAALIYQLRLHADVMPGFNCSSGKPTLAILQQGSLVGYDATGNLAFNADIALNRVIGIDVPTIGKRRVVQPASLTPPNDTYYGLYSLGGAVDPASLNLAAGSPEMPGPSVSGPLYPLTGETWSGRPSVNLLGAGKNDLALAVSINAVTCGTPESLSGVPVIATDVLVSGSAHAVDPTTEPAAAGVAVKSGDKDVPVFTFNDPATGNFRWIAKLARPTGHFDVVVTGQGRYDDGYANIDVSRTGISSKTTKQRLLIPVKQNENLYATVYTPGQGNSGIEGGMEGQQNIQFSCQGSDGSVAACDSNHTVLGSIIDGDFEPGAVAVNHPSAGSALYPLPPNIAGDGTWYFAIPGYNNGQPAPVTDTFAVGQSRDNAAVQPEGAARVDLAVWGSTSGEENLLNQNGGTPFSHFGATKVTAGVYWGTKIPETTTQSQASGGGFGGLLLPLQAMDGMWSNYWGTFYADGYGGGHQLLASGWDTIFSRGTLVPPSVILNGEKYDLIVHPASIYPRCNDPMAHCVAASRFTVTTVSQPWQDAGSFNANPGMGPEVGGTIVDYAAENTEIKFKLDFSTLSKSQRQLSAMWGIAITKLQGQIVPGSAFDHTYNDVWGINQGAYNTSTVAPPPPPADPLGDAKTTTVVANSPVATNPTPVTVPPPTPAPVETPAPTPAVAVPIAAAPDTSTPPAAAVEAPAPLTVTAPSIVVEQVNRVVDVVRSVLAVLNPEQPVVNPEPQAPPAEVVLAPLTDRALVATSSRLSDARTAQANAKVTLKQAATSAERRQANKVLGWANTIVSQRTRDLAKARLYVQSYQSAQKALDKANAAVASLSDQYQRATGRQKVTVRLRLLQQQRIVVQQQRQQQRAATVLTSLL